LTDTCQRRNLNVVNSGCESKITIVRTFARADADHYSEFIIVIDSHNKQLIIMISVKRCVVCSLLVAKIVLLLIPSVRAAAESFTVRARQEETKFLNLAVEDHVLIRFTVTGGTTSTLDFSITDPHGNVMETFDNTGNVNYAFVCSQEGEYKLNFSNIASAEDKLVSLDYEIEHYIFGMPQNLFLTFIIVGTCVAAVAAFILMSKHP
jgi:hypothetical protein